MAEEALPFYRRGAFPLVDFMARYQLNQNLSLVVNLENAFDKHYRVNFAQHNIGTPRNLAATLKYKF